MRGDFVASCAEDGKVAVRSLYETSRVFDELSFDRPVKAVALEPEFSHSKRRQLVVGGLAGELVLCWRETWGIFSTAKRKVVCDSAHTAYSQLHAGAGAIYSIRWRGGLIAWANDMGVMIYDTAAQERISYIDRPTNRYMNCARDPSPRADLYKCRLAWRDDTTLLIGWATCLKVAFWCLSRQIAVVRDGPSQRMGATGGAREAHAPPRLAEVVKTVTFDTIFAGIAPYGADIVGENHRRLLQMILWYQEAAAAVWLCFCLSFARCWHSSSPSPTSCSLQPGRDSALRAAQPEMAILSSRGTELSNDLLPIVGFEKYNVRARRAAHAVQ